MNNYRNFDYESRGNGNWQRNNRNQYNNGNSYGKWNRKTRFKENNDTNDGRQYDIYQGEIVEDKDHLDKVEEHMQQIR